MELYLEYKDLSEYLSVSKYVDFDKEIIIDKANKLFRSELDELQKVKIAFEYVRDEISHSWDIKLTFAIKG